MLPEKSAAFVSARDPTTALTKAIAYYEAQLTESPQDTQTLVLLADTTLISLLPQRGAAILETLVQFLTDHLTLTTLEAWAEHYQEAAELTLKNLPRYSAAVQPEAALVTLDPATGAILAMVGGRDYQTSPLNRSVKAHRQPGSALKPFVFATALEHDFTAATILYDQPLAIPLENGTVWTPENSDREYRGKITLRQALRESVNTIAVQLVQTLGIPTVATQLERMGIKSLVWEGKTNDLGYAPLALGGLTKGVTPLELAACVERADLDPNVHVILVSGRGEGFCAGFDLSAYADGTGAAHRARRYRASSVSMPANDTSRAMR